jgi:hypothetical protein
MKVRKFLSEEDKAILHDLYDSNYWPVFKKMLANDQLNIMQAGMSSNFDQEFYVNKGQLLHIERLKTEMSRIFKEIENKNKERNAKS